MVLRALAAIAAALLLIPGAWVLGVHLNGNGPRSSGEEGASSSQAAGSPAPISFADARGDARDLGISGFAYGPGGCRLSGCHVLPGAGSGVGTPSTTLDLVEAGFDGETSDALRFHIGINVLDDDFAWLEEVPTLHRIAYYSVCFELEGDPASRCATLEATRDDGQALTSGTFHVFSESCGEAQECAWDIETRLVPGSPGRVEFVVPKTYAAFGASAPALVALWARTEWFSTSGVLPGVHAAGTWAVGDQHRHGHAGPLFPYLLADEADRHGIRVPFQGLPSSSAAVEPGAQVVLGPGEVYGGGGLAADAPEMDLLRVEFRAEGTDLVVDFVAREFNAVPAYAMHYVAILGLPGGRIYELGFFHTTTEAYGYAGRCVSFECHDPLVEKVRYEVQPGAPGHLLIHVPLKLFGKVAAGTQTNFFWVISMLAPYDVRYLPGDGTHIDLHEMQLMDGHIGGHAFTFERALDGPESDHHHGSGWNAAPRLERDVSVLAVGATHALPQ